MTTSTIELRGITVIIVLVRETTTNERVCNSEICHEIVSVKCICFTTPHCLPVYTEHDPHIISDSVYPEEGVSFLANTQRESTWRNYRQTKLTITELGSAETWSCVCCLLQYPKHLPTLTLLHSYLQRSLIMIFH